MVDGHDGAGRWEHFRHDADIGIRGVGTSKARAFEQAALALTAVVTDLDKVHEVERVQICCDSADEEFLFLDWINALIFEMATRNMLFRRFHVEIEGTRLTAVANGEAIDVSRHCPAVEPKGATFTELSVRLNDNGEWLAQCIVDV